MKVVNLTNATIKLYPSSYSDIRIPVSEKDEAKFLNRCVVIPPDGHASCQITRETEQLKFFTSDGSRAKETVINYTHVGIVDGLPEPSKDTIFIVSQLLYNAYHHTRKDIFIIDKPVRNTSGVVIACRAFSRCSYDKDNELLDGTVKLLKKLFTNPNLKSEYGEIAKCIVDITKFKDVRNS